MSGRMQGIHLGIMEGDASTDEVGELRSPKHGIANYLVVVKRIHGNLFLVIMEKNESAQRNRIMVPINRCEEFLATLHEIKRFVPDYRSKIPAKTLIKCKRLAFTATMKTTTGMVYYFEVFEIDGNLSLQIRYIYEGRREYIYLNIWFLDLLVEIIEKLHRKYSSLTGRDDTVLDNSRRFDERTDIYSFLSGVNNIVILNNDFTPQCCQSPLSGHLISKLVKLVERKTRPVVNTNSDLSRSFLLYNLEKDKFDIFDGDDAIKYLNMENGNISTTTCDIAKDNGQEFQDGSTGMNPGIQHDVHPQERT